MPDEHQHDLKALFEAMTPDRWQAINDLLVAVLERPAAERNAFLRSQAEADPALRREVAALLAAHDVSGDFLEAPAAEYAAPILDTPEAPDLTGERVGAYRIVRPLGQGGMGVVYLAEREDVQKQVALKLVRDGLASAAHRQRFLFERRVLARLDHPHIAHLLDAGVTHTGAPYFAMEYVEGQPIDRYCDAHRLSIKKRLHLFEAVCEAVQYAHRNLVVHRDLKPSNMLVTDEGHVKLLDFGIAKLLEDEPTGPAMTRTGMRLMTPEYAAPEQLHNERITTATDVYALGVLLYELLTGRRPFEDPATGTHDMQRALLRQEPRKPSTTAGATGAAAATARATTPEKLRRRLAGDLDTICLKALRPDPTDRYPSAEQLLDDIRRHGAGLPVSARRGTVSYRTRKFIRRHRVGVLAAVAVVLALVGGLIATTRQARIAEAERQKAEEVAAILPELFWSLEPGELQNTAVTPEQMLDEGLEKIETQLRDQPEIQARVLTLATDLYMRLAVYDKAERAARQALALRHTLHGNAHPGTAASQAMLAQALDKQAKYAEAKPLHQKALATQRRFLGDNHLDLATSLHNYALHLEAQGHYADAVQHYTEAFNIRQAGAAPPRDIAYTQTNLAVNYYYLGRYDEAEPLYREALALRRRALGPDHPDVGNSLHNLAHLLRIQGKDEEAETLFRESLAIHRKVYGAEHLFVSYSLTSLADVLKKRGEYEEAERLIREALAIRRDRTGPSHPEVANSLYNLAGIRQARGARQEAQALYREALAMQREHLGVAHPSVATTLYSLGQLLAEETRYDDAAPLLREALTIRQRALPADHRDITQVRTALADLYEVTGDSLR